MLENGKVYRLKISGETVQLVEHEPTANDALVFRAKTTREGLYYESISVPIDGLETVEDNITREFKEAIFRQELMTRHLDAKDVAANEKPITEILN